MVNVQRWSAPGVGVCAALLLVAGCGSGGGINGVLAGDPPATAAATSGSGGGPSATSCQVSKVVSCLMPKPDSATGPSGKWAKDGVMTAADYVSWYSDPDNQSHETAELAADKFVSAGYSHWQGSHGVSAELTLLSFGSVGGATEWVDTDNRAFTNDKEIDKITTPSVPGIWMFADQNPNDDGSSYTTSAIGRFGQVVLECFAYSQKQGDPLAENQLASWAATQAGILKRAAS